MFVNDEKKIAFIHIPKTGGTAVARYILWPIGFRKTEGPRHGGYIPISNKYFVFSFVRNPYEVIVSRYRERALMKCNFRDKYPTVRSFIEFLIEDYKEFPKPLRQVDFLDPCVEIYRFENLEDGINDICERFKLDKPVIDKNSVNKFHGEYDWKDWVTPEDIYFINDYFHEDFSLGYDKWMP